MNMSLKGMMKSLNAKPGQVVSDPYARAFAAPLKEAEGQDHEVSMAKGSLEAIVKHATELMGKLGNEEKDIPGWIQDHIAKAESYIGQANDQYHEYGTNESVNEGISILDERPFGKKGIIIMIDDNGKKVSAIFKDKKNADKYNRNKESDINALLKIAKTKPFGKAIDESVNEAAADTYVVYIMDGIGKKKVREIADKNSAIQMVKKLMTSPKIEGAGWMSASAWQKEPFRVS